jgi:hypothetical protein
MRISLIAKMSCGRDEAVIGSAAGEPQGALPMITAA